MWALKDCKAELRTPRLYRQYIAEGSTKFHCFLKWQAFDAEMEHGMWEAKTPKVAS